MSLNKVQLIGRLGQDVELKYMPNGNPVANMSVATSQRWNDKTTGEKKEKVEWHRVVVFGKQAENCNQYLHKGSMVYVEGMLQTRSWDDQNGQKRYATEIVSNDVQFLSAPAQQGQGQAPAQQQQQTQQPPQGQQQRPPYQGQQQQAYGQGQQQMPMNPPSDFASDDIPF